MKITEEIIEEVITEILNRIFEDDKKENHSDKFDDSAIKEIISKFKRNMDEVSDCLFVEACEIIGEMINLNEFDSLLKKESFSREEAKKVYDMIECSSNVFRDCIKKRVESLKILYNRF